MVGLGTLGIRDAHHSRPTQNKAVRIDIRCKPYHRAAIRVQTYVDIRHISDDCFTLIIEGIVDGGRG